MDQRIIDLYDDFVHVHYDRRLFLQRAAKLMGGTAAAAALLPLLRSNYALAATVPENDPRIATEPVTFPGASGEMKGYLAKTKADGKHGGIVVAHQNRGLNPHIEDVARRLAVEGYVTLAVDFLSPLGGTPKDEDEAMKLFGKLDRNQTGNAKAAADWLRARRRQCQGRNRRLLLGRRRREPARRRRSPAFRRRRLLRCAPGPGIGAADQGGHAAALRRPQARHADRGDGSRL
jgi:hypothetical protein